GGGKGSTVSISDQRRALLLPQEVKEIGMGRAIIFYEGLRPIVGDKIRYYEDERFKVRLRPTPVLTPIDIGGAPRGKPETFDPDDAQTAPESMPEERVRPVEASDMPRLNELRLEDYAVNFDHVMVPKDRSTTDQEMKTAVGQFMVSFLE